MENKKTMNPHYEVITEDKHGLKRIDGLLARMTGVPESSSSDGHHGGDSLHGPVSDGQVVADGSATLTYDAGQVAWTLESGDAPTDKVASLLRILAGRLRFLDETGVLPSSVSPAPESADVSIVPNAFG